MRLPVTRCVECPFSVGGRGGLACRVAAESAPVAFDATEPPAWCPLRRGAVVVEMAPPSPARVP